MVKVVLPQNSVWNIMLIVIKYDNPLQSSYVTSDKFNIPGRNKHRKGITKHMVPDLLKLYTPSPSSRVMYKEIYGRM